MTTPEVLTVPEVMSSLRLSRAKVYDLIRSGRLGSFTEGKCRRIPVAAVAAYIDHKMAEVSR